LNVRGHNNGQQVVETIENSAKILHIALMYKFYAKSLALFFLNTYQAGA